MKNLSYVLLIALAFFVTSCEAIGDIFSAGFYAGMAVVVAVIVLIVWLIGRRRG